MKLQSKFRLKRKSAEWLRHLDERILERLDNADEPLTAWQLAHDLDSPTRRRVVKRCRVLAHAEFTVVLPRDGLENQFDITGWGQRYLEGEIDADHRRPLPAPKPPGKVRPGWYAGFEERPTASRLR